MRYLILIFVGLGDILLVAAVVIVLYSYRNPLAWLLVAIALIYWHQAGGFKTWYPSNVKKFLTNAQKYCGL